MTKIFAVLFSLQLILSPVALAQATGGGSAGDQFREAPAKKGGMDLYAKQILGLGTSAIGANILTSCKLGKMLPSLMIFMGGSLINIASELLGGKAQNENHKKRAASLKMLEEKMKQQPGGELQKESLEQALKEEKETLAFINKRKMWAMAVTAAYLAAAAATFIEKAMMVTNPAGAAAATNAGCLPNEMSRLTAVAISMAYNFVASKTGEGGAISTYGGLALGLVPLVSGLNNAVAATYNTVIGRKITFTASAVLMGLITKGLMDRAKVTKENIEKLERALANFKDQTKTTTGVVADSTSGSEGGGAAAEIDPATGKNFAINTLPDGTPLPKECWSSTSQGMEFSNSACKSPVRVPSVGFNGNLNVPTLTSAAGLTTDIAQQVANGNIGAAEASAAELGAMAGKLKQINDNFSKKLNDELIAKGEKPIDFEGEAQKKLGSMMSDLGKLSGSTTNLAADLKPASATDLEEAKKESNPSINTASAGTTMEVPSATGGVITEGLVNDPSLSETVAQNELPADYEYNEEDVSDRQDVSIFEQVSNRYLFQYKKLFKREEPKPVP